MEENAISGVFASLIPLAIFGFFLYFIISFSKKFSKIKKLKSGETSSKEIKGIVSEIKYNTSGKNNSGNINSWYFIAKGNNPITNEETEFESNVFPYKDGGFKIRLMGPNEEDINKLLEYVRAFIKEGDSINIHISNEDPDIYYIEDVVKNDNAFNNIPLIANDIRKFTNSFNIGGSNNSGIFAGFKKLRIVVFIIMIMIFVGPTILTSINDSNNGINLDLPKIKLGMNINFGGSYIVWIILALLIVFVIYKVITGYRGIKK